MIYDGLIIIRGGGDLATGTIYRLWKSGFRLLVLEAENPAAIRRAVAVSEAVFQGKTQVEDMTAVLIRDAGEADTSFLHISTHGVLLEEGGTTRPAPVLSDGLREETLSPEELKAWMDEISGKKVLILDCCHAEAVTKAFTGPEWRTLASCRAEEDSYFWAAGEVTGTGYFTAALENALRASAREQIDPDGNGEVSLMELA
jgi:uncharacterized caspase-like protein